MASIFYFPALFILYTYRDLKITMLQWMKMCSLTNAHIRIKENKPPYCINYINAYIGGRYNTFKCVFLMRIQFSVCLLWKTVENHSYECCVLSFIAFILRCVQSTKRKIGTKKATFVLNGCAICCLPRTLHFELRAHLSKWRAA